MNTSTNEKYTSTHAPLSEKIPSNESSFCIEYIDKNPSPPPQSPPTLAARLLILIILIPIEIIMPRPLPFILGRIPIRTMRDLGLGVQKSKGKQRMPEKEEVLITYRSDIAFEWEATAHFQLAFIIDACLGLGWCVSSGHAEGYMGLMIIAEGVIGEDKRDGGESECSEDVESETHCW
ncbi:hypothetical protein EJ05DRAFT_517368 [Pseudovirgaria hyperparasitica]|uniref:Uncharacterized protein n=1 Tax=Pseudovirgaria hyperparasitica TaxID=470096 RepID=A0A6A6W7C2_9PEZI|nr:uncharacterized protein EJ05DRAFT_517368 [Pseudovirgaria hyperparasitica]KAF2756981.1 hypothetical protein EJ05DRAFT_517368 [Pseudovirgaria hyperparasitica]